MRRVLAMLLAAVSLGCGPAEPELRPTAVSRGGGELLRVRFEPPGQPSGGEGGVIVLVDGVAAHATVIEAPGLVRAELPPLRRAGVVDVELHFADGAVLSLPGALEVEPARVQVRARE